MNAPAAGTVATSGVCAEGVHVVLGDRAVLSDVSLTVPTGRWLGLIGRNGAGKTTLLRVLAGQQEARGALAIPGGDPRRMSRRTLARSVAFVPQQPVVPPGLQVLDYVLLGRTPYIARFGVESGADVAVCRGLLDRLDLAGFEGRLLSSLSGGEFQRAVLARALAQEAPLLLLDEPTSALDVGHQQDVLTLVDDLRRERGLTVVAAMHDLTTAAQVAERLLLLDGGRVAATGRPDQVLTAPLLARHLGAQVRILDHPDGGIVVVPARPSIGDVPTGA